MRVRVSAEILGSPRSAREIVDGATPAARDSVTIVARRPEAIGGRSMTAPLAHLTNAQPFVRRLGLNAPN